MSNSVFKELPSASATCEETNKKSNEMVIIINKTGYMSVDQSVLQNFLLNEDVAANTSVSVLRIASPTPSMNDDSLVEIEDDNKSINSESNASDEKSIDSEEEEDNGKRKKLQKKNIVPITIEEFYGPEKAKILASEILKFASITNPIQIDLDFDFRRYGFRNDHCYTPLTSPSQRKNLNLIKDNTLTAPGTNSVQGKSGSDNSNKKIEESVKSEPNEISAEETNEDEVSDSDDITSSSNNESDNDRESDLDYSVYDRPSGRLKKSKRRYSRVVNSQRSKATIKRTVNTEPVNDKQLNADIIGSNKKKVVKVITPRQSSSIPEISLSNNTDNSQLIGKVQIPKLVRKLPYSIVVTPTHTPPKVAKMSTTSTPILKGKIDSSKSLVKSKVSETSIIPKKPSISSNELPTIKYVTAGPSTPRLQTHGILPIEQDKHLDLIDAIVKQELEGEEIMDSYGPDDIPNIVKMLETTDDSDLAGFPSSTLDLIKDKDLTDPNVIDDDFINEFINEVGDLSENKHLDEIIQKDLKNIDIEQSSQMINQFPFSSTSMINESATIISPAISTQRKSVEDKSATKGEMKQIIRHDGRVITLPPIEAPTTRSALRKARNIIKPAPSTNDTNTETMRTANVSQSGSIDNESNAAAALSDSDTDASYNSEDDPHRLWCICRQPHNNRFMICCDSCEDWFHGKCVNITKAMGREMELQGKEWRCPDCITKHSVNGGKKNEMKITKYLIKPEEKSSVVLGSETIVNTQKCLTCKKPCRSVFCSENCKKTNPSIKIITSVVKPVDNPKPNVIDSKPVQSPKVVVTQGCIVRNNRVYVFERKTGKCLTGTLAPTVENLRQWLREHPTFEIVKPGSPQDTAIRLCQEKKLIQQGTQPPQLTQMKIKIGTNKQLDLFKPDNLNNAVKSKQIIVKTEPKVLNAVQARSITTVQGVPQQHARIVIKPTIQAVPVATTTVKVQRADSSESAKPKTVKTEEPIRGNVRRTLAEHLKTRMVEEKSGNKANILNDEEIQKFATDTENAMFILFNKDTGTKYKSKYRSLVFNIKDRKNKTLFQKICDRSIEPNKLVRMSPEELASQELAQWRENENKHQLDIIKQSELDSISYAAKASSSALVEKEEIIIESKISDAISNNVKDFESDNKSEEYSNKLLSKSYLDLHVNDSSSGSQSNSEHHHHRSHKKESKSNRSRDDSRSSTKPETSGPNHSRDKDRHRHHSKSSSHRKTTSEKSHKHSSSKHHESSKSSSHKKSDKDDSKKASSGKAEINEVKPTIEDCNLVDAILKSANVILPSAGNKTVESTKNSEPKKIDNLVDELKITPVPALTPIVTVPAAVKPIASTSTAPLWIGNIRMVDVASFKLSICQLSGDFNSIVKLLPKELEVVGRISPNTVWDYIAKIQKSPNKEIMLVNLLPSEDSDQSQWFTLYDYMFTKNRLGVIKTISPITKDFYLMPLPENQSLPNVLPHLNIGARGNLLIGVIVKTGPVKRMASLDVATIPKVIKPSVPLLSSDINSKSSARSLPKISTKSDFSGPIAFNKDEADEPYSPGGSDENSGNAMFNEQDIQKEMELIKQKIAEQEKQIAGIMGTSSAIDGDEPYSPSKMEVDDFNESQPAIPGLGDLPIPKRSNEATMSSIASLLTSNDDEEYDPMETVSNPLTLKTVTNKYVPMYGAGTSSRLAKLSDEELLKLVPDNET